MCAKCQKYAKVAILCPRLVRDYSNRSIAQSRIRAASHVLLARRAKISVPNSLCAMNIVLPLGRLTCSFDGVGYNKPLQLTPVLGRPLLFWLLDSLEIGDEDIVWLVLSASDEATYLIHGTLGAEYRELRERNRLRLISLYYRTQGVAETLQVAMRYMQDEDLKRPTLCLNSDMIFSSNVLKVTAALSSNSALCFLADTRHTETHTKTEASWSYCQLSATQHDLNDLWLHGEAPGTDVDMFEIHPTSSASSSHSNTAVMMGAYAFGSAWLLRERLASLLSTSAPGASDAGFPELIYTSAKPLGALMRGKSCIPLKNTTYLEAFTKSALSAQSSFAVKSTRYIFQMYGGLLKDGDEPREHAIDAVKQLKSLGHHIIVSSNRGRSAEAVRTLIQHLEKYEICYDEIDFHEDDRDYTVIVGANVVDIQSDLHKALGIPRQHTFDDTIKPRHFNQLSVSTDQIIKTSDVSHLSGEAYFYEHIPPSLESVFPRLISRTLDSGKLTIVISRIPGITYSQLLVNRCIDAERLTILCDTVKVIHDECGFEKKCDTTINHYSNYAKKVERRFLANRQLYEDIGDSKSLTSVLTYILPALRQYETERRANVCAYIHGDPVFSNCILSPENKVFLIDMNGRQEDILTTSGDSTYDLGKILQSLYGYDFILLDVEVSQEDSRCLRKLRETFRSYISENYEQVSWRDVLLTTASLFVSLIPLHDNLRHQVAFWELGVQVLRDWKAIKV